MRVVIKRSIETQVELPAGCGCYALANTLSLWARVDGAAKLAACLRELADQFDALGAAEKKRAGDEP